MHQLVLKVYEYTKDFPSEEKFGLTSDMRRAARSIKANFVEGYKRKGYKDAMNFFNRSDASLEELEDHTLIALDLKYLPKAYFDELENLEREVAIFLDRWQKEYHERSNGGPGAHAHVRT